MAFVCFQNVDVVVSRLWIRFKNSKYKCKKTFVLLQRVMPVIE